MPKSKAEKLERLKRSLEDSQYRSRLTNARDKVMFLRGSSNGYPRDVVDLRDLYFWLSLRSQPIADELYDKWSLANECWEQIDKELEEKSIHQSTWTYGTASTEERPKHSFFSRLFGR